MSLIDQAAKRLEELRRAGIAAGDPAVSLANPGSARTAERTPLPEAAAVAAHTWGRSAVEAPAGPRTVQPPPPGRPTHQHVELDLVALKARGFITPDSPRARIADDFRVIKRPIIGNAIAPLTRVHKGNLVMVTSAVSGEGKTFTSINLAMSLAMELDTTVLLIDGDVASPGFPGVLQTPSGPGLIELLTRDDIEPADALIRTNVPNLTILPAGAHHERATELLASAQMAKLLDQLSSRYPDRIMVFDSPPLLATTEARVLASHMGQVVMVVAADNTRRHAVSLALSTIEGCDVVLTVLNKAVQSEVGTYGYDYRAA